MGRRDRHHFARATSHGSANRRKLRVAELLTLCGVKYAELEPHLQKYKGRIVYRGDRVLDEHSNLVIFQDTATTPTALTALNLCLWFGSLPEHEVSCSDAIQAYLQSELEEETHVVIWKPEWVEKYGPQAKLVVQLKKSLYGHPQAGRLWQEYLSRILTSLNGRESQEFPSNWIFEFPQGVLVLNIYVDDLSLCGHKSLHARFWQELRKRVKLDPEVFVGPEGVRILGRLHCMSRGPTSTVTTFSMGEYVSQVIDAYCELTGLSPDALKKVPTPCLPESAMTDEEAEAQGQLHDSAAKVLMRALWLARLCRADVSFAVARLAARVPQWSRWEDRQLHRLVAYLYHSADLCLHASSSRERPLQLQVFTDADFAACPFTSKSTSGILIRISTGSHTFPILWQSKKQSSVARSTPEAECISMAAAMFGEVFNSQTLLQDILQDSVPVVLLQDNETVLKVLSNGYSYSSKLRHMSRVHRVNIASMAEVLEREDYTATYVQSKQQVANGLTKIIPPAEWPEMLQQLSLGVHPPVLAQVSLASITSAEEYARSIPHVVDQQDIVQLLSYLPISPSTSHSFSSGAVSVSRRAAAINRNLNLYPASTAVICRLVRRVLPKHHFSNVTVFKGCHCPRARNPAQSHAASMLSSR